MASIYSVSSYNADLEPAGQITSGKSIHETFVRCLDLYRSLTFQILDKENSETGVEDEVDLNRLMDEFGRLRIWGEQTKASLAPKARASLDDFLRNEERLNKEVKEVLAQLGTQLSLAVSVVKETGQQHSALDGNISDGMVSDSDYSSENGSEESIDRGNERPKVSKLSIIVSHIFEHIQLLYHFGSLLRRPGLKGRYLRHNDSNNLDTATLFDTWHIEEKLRQWSRQAGEGIIVSPKEEDAVTVQKISEREAGESPKSLHYVLSRRFAKANAQRREQLKYWTNHPYQLRRPQEPKMNMTKGKALKSAIQKRPKKGDASTEDDVSTIKPESKGPKSEKSRSTTAVSFSTVAESALLESGTETGKARTIYAESVVAGKWSARVPPPPKRTTAIDGPEQYECPYCHMNLDSELVNHRLAWKRHVFRDLRPYSCTFADCSNPNKLYTTRHEWKYHEMQIHRRSWICHECNLGFEEKHELVQHLHESHPGNWTDRQLSIILEMSERPMEESIILPCSLCKSELSLAKLLDHLAAHMEEISLFVLPNDSEFDDDTNSNNVMGTDTQESGDKRETSPLSSLRFSDIAQSDRDALEGEGLIPFFQSPTASRSDGINLVTNEETGSYTSVPSLDSILDKLLGVAHNTTAEPTPLSRLEIRYLCAEAKEIFMSQSVLLELEAPIKICGDVRGQSRDLLRLFESCGFPPEANYLFMGNYLGGEPYAATICLLLAYKIKYPENFFLLRGSQEAQEVPPRFTEFQEYMDVWEPTNDVFRCLPFAAIVDDRIFVVHSGLSPDLDSMEQIRCIMRPTDVIPADHWFSHLVLANPSKAITGWAKNIRGSWVFGPDVVSSFLQKHDLQLICRSHEMVEGGYEFFAEKQLVTVYSVPSYRDIDVGGGAVMCVDESLVCSFQMLSPKQQLSHSILMNDLESSQPESPQPESSQPESSRPEISQPKGFRPAISNAYKRLFNRSGR